MDESLRAALRAIAEEAAHLADEVDAVLDEHASFASRLEVRRKVEDVSRRYRDRMAHVTDEKVRFAAERSYGRRVVDLLKLATPLPADPHGKPAEKPADTGWLQRRAPKSSRPPVVPGLAPGERLRDRNQVRVTGEIDAWCGRCGMVRTQIVAAVVDGEPAQVVCQVCRSRSRYREGPPRGKKEKAAPRRKPAAPPPPSRKEKERNELLEALRNAENVRPFEPKERYKVGEIIDHPEHGRGRIENTLPRSLLVRFAAGLRPVKLG